MKWVNSKRRKKNWIKSVKRWKIERSDGNGGADNETMRNVCVFCIEQSYHIHCLAFSSSVHLIVFVHGIFFPVLPFSIACTLESFELKCFGILICSFVCFIYRNHFRVNDAIAMQTVNHHSIGIYGLRGHDFSQNLWRKNYAQKSKRKINKKDKHKYERIYNLAIEIHVYCVFHWVSNFNLSQNGINLPAATSTIKIQMEFAFGKTDLPLSFSLFYPLPVLEWNFYAFMSCADSICCQLFVRTIQENDKRKRAEILFVNK